MIEESEVYELIKKIRSSSPGRSSGSEDMDIFPEPKVDIEIEEKELLINEKTINQSKFGKFCVKWDNYEFDKVLIQANQRPTKRITFSCYMPTMQMA